MSRLVNIPILAVFASSCAMVSPHDKVEYGRTTASPNILVQVVGKTMAMAASDGNDISCFSYRPWKADNGYVVTIKRQAFIKKLDCRWNGPLNVNFDAAGRFTIFTPVR